MREKFARFMMGRYGVDDLARVTSISALVFLIISMFSGFLPVLGIFYWLALALIIYNCFRMLSRNVQKRYAENQKFLNARYRFTAKKTQQKTQWAQRKIYRFYRCPSCRQKVRVPKGRGKICITCPKCKTEFVKRS